MNNSELETESETKCTTRHVQIEKKRKKEGSIPVSENHLKHKFEIKSLSD